MIVRAATARERYLNSRRNNHAMDYRYRDSCVRNELARQAARASSRKRNNNRDAVRQAAASARLSRQGSADAVLVYDLPPLPGDRPAEQQAPARTRSAGPSGSWESPLTGKRRQNQTSFAILQPRTTSTSRSAPPLV